MVEIQNPLTDPELYALCKKWGAEALLARRKFIGLLPEVNSRRLYERRNFRSIYHFAAVLGGVSEHLVNEVLRLEKRFEAMPTMHLALVKGEIGMSKLARVVSVVEVGNEAEVCGKIRLLSRRAVDVLAREMAEGRGKVTNSGGLFGNDVWRGERWEIGNSGGLLENHLSEDSRGGAENQSGLQKPPLRPKSLAGQNFDFEILNALSPELKAKLKELIDKEIDINSILLKALAEREAAIAEKKAEIGATPAKSRYIPAKVRRILVEEFGRKCAYLGCRNPAEQVHHEKPYASYHDHDPRDLKPLCRGHHELVHGGGWRGGGNDQ